MKKMLPFRFSSPSINKSKEKEKKLEKLTGEKKPKDAREPSTASKKYQESILNERQEENVSDRKEGEIRKD